MNRAQASCQGGRPGHYRVARNNFKFLENTRVLLIVPSTNRLDGDVFNFYALFSKYEKKLPATPGATAWNTFTFHLISLFF
jgi:hypothetical protein